jgi:rod shape determining protein RodA
MITSRDIKIKYAIDWVTILMYLAMVVMGWFSIYGASYDFEQTSIFDFSHRAGKQFVWIITGIVIAAVLLMIDYKVYSVFAYHIYVSVMLLLLITIFIAPDIKGSRSWLVFGPISFQPAELAKMATALVIAKFMSTYNYKLKSWRDLIKVSLFVLLPLMLIILQKETGSALVFFAFFLVFYREGMSGLVLLLAAFAVVLFIITIRFGAMFVFDESGTLGLLLAVGLILLIQVVYAVFFTKNEREGLFLLGGVAVAALMIFLLKNQITFNVDYLFIGALIASCIYWCAIALLKRFRQFWYLAAISIVALAFCLSGDYFFEKVLEPHQQNRIMVLLNMKNDPANAGYNVNQSKIAIGSGGLWGKGFLNGTQTKLKYVPEQDTDFIFCTVGEEHGFVGSSLVLILYSIFLLRLLHIAERQRESFNRIYAYGVVSVFFFHLMVNVGMVLGLMPVIGIPLPFFSYGGSSLWLFTILLFILLRLDASRLERMR